MLEVTGLALGISTLIAVALLLFRRVTNVRVAAVTTVIDWLVLAALLLQVATGVYIAFTLRWGSVWYLHTATPGSGRSLSSIRRSIILQPCRPL